MAVYLVRHPRPLDGAGLCYGRLDLSVDDVTLLRTVAAVRSQLRGVRLVGTSVFTSPARRCRVLARELALPDTAGVVDDLAELDFGSWEGVPWHAIPRAELDGWAADVWDYAPGGGECVRNVAQRWLRWSAGLMHAGLHTGAVHPGEVHTIAVTHAGFIKVALYCSGLLAAAEFAHATIDYGGVYRIELASVPA